MERKNFLHDVILHNFGIKILSLLGAVLVWMIIINIDDPYKTKTFQVKVETINEQALQSVNKVYEITSGDIASVKVGGKRSVIDRLDATDIRATADLANLSSVNAVAIEPSLRKKVSSPVTLECTQVLKVALEDMATKQIKVTVLTQGSPSEGYSIGGATAKPNMVQVTGGKSIIKRIETVKVTVNTEGVSEDFTSRLEPVAYDANDEVVQADTLRFSESKIKVKVKVLENKTIPVKVNVTGTPAAGYEYVETECLPQEIEIAGSEKKMESMSELTIDMDINGLTSDSSQLEKTVDVSTLLPEGITVSEEYETISVKVTIEALEERSLQVKAGDISFRNLGSGLIAEILDPEKMLTLTVSGRKSLLDALPNTALKAYVDCSGLKTGNHRVAVQMDLGDACKLSRGASIRIVISKEKDVTAKKDESVNPTEAPTSSPVGTPTEAPTQEPAAAPEETKNPEQ